MLKLLKLLREYRKEAVLAPAFKLLEALFELFVPLVVASIIDNGIANSHKAHIIKMAVVMVVLSFVGFTASVIAQYFSAKASVGFATKIRSKLFTKIMHMSYSELDKAGTSSLITHMTSDINQIQTGTNLTLRLFMRSPCIVFGAMIMAFTINTKLALIFTAMITVLSVIVFTVILGTVPLYKKVQNSLGALTGNVRENIGGVRIIKGFRKEDSEKESFVNNAAELERSQKFVGRITALMNPLTYLVVNGAIMFLIYRGAINVKSGNLTQGEVIALYNYMTQILVELVKLANLIITITKAIACGQRVQGVIDSVQGEYKTDKKHETKNGLPKVEFRNVSFRYPSSGELLLKNISFSVNAGDTVGIIGATGSGKTTLVNLIPAFYDVTDGEVLLDGINVTDIDKLSLRKRFGIVPQTATLVKDTLRENLNWRNADATDEEIMRIAKLACVDNVILDKKDGLDSYSDQMGKNFSGGQRQRLTVARALVGEPEILILDDSSSALDYATDAALRRAIASLPYEHTTFIVSQRTSAILDADKIIVLDDGEIIGIGTHDELYNNCITYREIHDLQFSSNGDGE